ncbi:uncharacterized protein LOC129951356 [Eupeodes corollae]|uniref:uncharacterized protein LOC129951356 n=1 Tax=Eupeodes corollae TaxID=290404 RepID=UPI002492264F|nr:uncharacterized protein LOC129951356 [Eupeodes corollae]
MKMKINILVQLIFITIFNVVLGIEEPSNLESIKVKRAKESSFDNCFDAFTTSVDSLSGNIDETIEACFKEAEHQKNALLAIFENKRSANINKTDIIQEKFKECSNTAIKEYASCIQSVVTENSNLLNDIATQEKEFSEKIINHNVGESCVNNAFDNSNQKILDTYDQLYSCMSIIPY